MISFNGYILYIHIILILSLIEDYLYAIIYKALSAICLFLMRYSTLDGHHGHYHHYDNDCYNCIACSVFR